MAKLIALLKRDFKREGQTLTEFAAEYKQLTPKDLDDFTSWYEAEGETVERSS